MNGYIAATITGANLMKFATRERIAEVLAELDGPTIYDQMRLEASDQEWLDHHPEWMV